jgi:hypothetical protein
MALLAFESSPMTPPAIAELLSPAQRMKTAGEVNAAILESLSQGKEVKLVGLLKLLCWGESLLDEHAEFPKVRLSRLPGDIHVRLHCQPQDQSAEWHAGAREGGSERTGINIICPTLIL